MTGPKKGLGPPFLPINLSLKQRRFVAEYISDQNATQAALRAGYSKKTAQEQGSRLLSKVMVRRAIDAAIEEVSAETKVDAAYVLTALKEVVERCMQRRPVMVFDRERRRMEQAKDENGQGIWEFDSMGTNRALELLGRNLGMWVDRHEHTGKDGAPLVPPPPKIDFSRIDDSTLMRIAGFQDAAEG